MLARSGCLAVGIRIILFPAFLAAQTHASVKTTDGFELAIAPNGLVAAIRFDKRELPLSREPAMFRIRDAAAKVR